MMGTNLFFWIVVFLWTTALITQAVLGWRAIRSHDLERHRHRMTRAAWMVIVFLVAYLIKLGILGGEAVETWPLRDRWVLYVHETFVLIMVVAGAWALVLARGFDVSLDLGGAATKSCLRHRWAGRVAIVCGILGLLTAAMVLGGMMHRGA